MNQAQELFNLNVTDYVIIGVILVSTLISLMRGFLREFISLFIWILGFWVAMQFYNVFAIVLLPYIANDAMRHLASFTGIFVLVLILGAVFNHIFSFIVVRSGLSGTDRVLGMIFGCARGVLLVAVFLLLISSTAFVQDEWWQKSVVIPHLQVVIDWLKVFLPQKLVSIKDAV